MSRRQFPLIVFIFGLFLLREASRPPLLGIDEAYVGWLAANGMNAAAPAPVTLVEINDESLQDHAWPWSPLDYALFLDGALRFQPTVAAIEPVLAWNEKALPPGQAAKQPQFEKILVDRVLRTPKLLLGARLGFPDDPELVPPLQPVPILRRFEGSLAAVPEFTDIDSEPGEDIRLSAALGFTNLPDPGPARRAPLLFRYRGELVPAFVLQGLILWYGLTPDDVFVRPGISVELGDKLAIPIDQTGAMLVDWQTPYTRIGFNDFLLGVEQVEAHHAPLVAPEMIRGKLAMLARTDEASRRLLLPSRARGSEGELFAAALATAMSRSFARRAGWEGDVAVLALGTWLACLLASRSKPFAVFGAFAAIILYLIASLLLYEAARIAMPLTPMLGLAAIAAALRLSAPASEP